MTVKLGSMRLLRPAIVAVGMTTCVVPIADGTQPTSLLDRLVTILNTADQQAFLVFINANYAPSSLAEEDAEHRAAALARTFTDTGGFANTRIVSETPTEVLAEARARITDIPYCLRLHRVQQQNAELATDFTAHEMFPMGPPLRTPSPREVRDEVDALASRYAAQDLFSGVILIAHDQRIVLHPSPRCSREWQSRSSSMPGSSPMTIRSVPCGPSTRMPTYASTLRSASS